MIVLKRSEVKQRNERDDMFFCWRHVCSGTMMSNNWKKNNNCTRQEVQRIAARLAASKLLSQVCAVIWNTRVMSTQHCNPHISTEVELPMGVNKSSSLEEHWSKITRYDRSYKVLSSILEDLNPKYCGYSEKHKSKITFFCKNWHFLTFGINSDSVPVQYITVDIQPPENLQHQCYMRMVSDRAEYKAFTDRNMTDNPLTFSDLKCYENGVLDKDRPCRCFFNRELPPMLSSEAQELTVLAGFTCSMLTFVADSQRSPSTADTEPEAGPFLQIQYLQSECRLAVDQYSHIDTLLTRGWGLQTTSSVKPEPQSCKNRAPQPRRQNRNL